MLFDGGILTGQSLLKALALGARAGLIGKAFLYGLGAPRRPEVTRVIEIIRKELSVSLALTGQTDVQRVERDILLDERANPILMAEEAAIRGQPEIVHFRIPAIHGGQARRRAPF